MSIRNLDKLFKPASVALIGATARERKLGAIALYNLLGGGYQGEIWPVNPKYDELMGQLKQIAAVTKKEFAEVGELSAA